MNDGMFNVVFPVNKGWSSEVVKLVDSPKSTFRWSNESVYAFWIVTVETLLGAIGEFNKQELKEVGMMAVQPYCTTVQIALIVEHWCHFHQHKPNLHAT